MAWHPYFDLRCDRPKTDRTVCRECDTTIPKTQVRVELLPVLGKARYAHLDCAADRAPDLMARKLAERDPSWPEEVWPSLERLVPEGAEVSPHGYQRTPILDLSYDGRGQEGSCVYCGEDCPRAGGGPGLGHAIRAFSLDGERRLHPVCCVKLAPGLCRRVVEEGSDRWPVEVRAWFREVIPPQIAPTPRSPWQYGVGEPTLEVSSSARAQCKYCASKIAKGVLRVRREQSFGTKKTPFYVHPECYVKSDDYHPKLLELMVVRAPADVPRAALEALVALAPDDPPPLEGEVEGPSTRSVLEGWVAARPEAAEEGAEAAPALTKNEVQIPEGFFNL